jgi:hypothetical protein
MIYHTTRLGAVHPNNTYRTPYKRSGRGASSQSPLTNYVGLGSTGSSDQGGGCRLCFHSRAPEIARGTDQGDREPEISFAGKRVRKLTPLYDIFVAAMKEM